MKIRYILTIFLSFTLIIIFTIFIASRGEGVKDIFKSKDDFIIIPDMIESNKDSIKYYPDLTKLLKKSNIEVPIYENLIPQGLAVVDDYIFITVYDNFGLINSKVYVIDLLGNMINVASLESNSHVGGIAYDKKNNLIWIPDNDGILNAYNKKDFFKKSHVFCKYRFEDLSDGLIDFNDSKKNAIDYLTIDGENLFIGSFAKYKKGLVKKYHITNNIELEYINSFEVREKIQGITFYGDYMLLSSSYGRKKTSNLYVYKYDENIDDYSKKEIVSYKLPSMLEQIVVDKDEVYLIFENTAKKYFDSIDKVGYICVLDAQKVINKKD